ncbi:MAG: Gfo/Idh/MocA family protein [Mycobacteriales bacterium]
MTVRWGIAATGGIATSFAKALTRVEDASLQAVSSRSLDRATVFAAEHGAAQAYGSLSQLLDDPDVDIVYVASPHSEHCREALAAVEAGKHVLVEKPFGLNAEETAKVFDAAAGAGVFVMEGVWSRFLPAHVRLRELVAEGVIGEIRSVEASFGFPMPYGPEHRLFDPALGGGALLDLGIYPVNTALQLLGPPVEVTATAALGETGVDVNTLVALRFDGGAVASAHCSLTAMLPNTARVIGTLGWIELPGMHHCAESLVLRSFGPWPEPPKKEVLELPVGDDGLRYQVHEVHRCLAEGRQQSDVMSWQHTLDLMSTMDRARECIGLRYPNER